MLINRKDARLYYPLEGNVNDYAGGGADASVNGTSTYVDSISGKAFDFDGSTQINTGIANLNNGSFSVLLRGSFDAFTSNQRLISYQTSGTGNPSWLLRYDNTASSVKFFVRNQADSGYHTCEIADSLLSTGTIYAIHAYFDAGTEVGIEVYEQDGTLNTNTSSTTDTTFTNNSSNLVIGSDSNLSSPTDYLNGVIDDCIYIDGSKITSDEFYRFYLGLGLEDNVTFSNNYSIDFDGVDEYIDLGIVDDFNFENDDTFSVSAWVKVSNTATTRCIVSRVGNEDSRLAGWFLSVNTAERIQFGLGRDFSGGNSRILRTTDTAISTGSWVHVCMTYDGSVDKSGVNIYINGTAETTWNQDIDNLSSMQSTTTTTINSLIGARDNASQYFDGQIDELSVWDKELSSAEVTELYNSGTPTNLKVHSANANLVSWYKMGDRGGVLGTIPDEVGSNDGTPTNLEASDIKLDTP